MTPKQALKAAITKVETQAKLAELIGTAQQNISYDLRIGKAGHTRVLAIEQATGISKHDLRPDLYPKD